MSRPTDNYRGLKVPELDATSATGSSSSSSSRSSWLVGDAELDPSECVRQTIPSLESVRKDAVIRRKFETNAIQLDPQVWEEKLPNLFAYSLAESPEQVPHDLLQDVVFALQMWQQAFTECQDYALKTWGVCCSQTEGGVAVWYMSLTSVRYRLSYYLWLPTVNRPSEAIQHYQHITNSLKWLLIFHQSPLVNTPWLKNIELYTRYADVLIMAGRFDTETKNLLETLVEATSHPSLSQYEGIEWFYIAARMDLALLLERMGIEPDKQKMHTEWALKQLRKRPHLRSRVAKYVARRNPFRHPVIEALGLEWFEERPLTVREEIRAVQMCASCSGRSPLKTLARCSGCGISYYCSRECQKAHYPKHRQACKSTIQFKKRPVDLKRLNPKIVSFRTLFIDWIRVPHFANREALVFALGLHRDPSRGQTHIVLRQVKRVPPQSQGQFKSRLSGRDGAAAATSAVDVRTRFHVVKCSVYRIKDVLHDIEGFLRLDRGRGEAAILDAMASLKSRLDVPQQRRGAEVATMSVTIEEDGKLTKCSHAALVWPSSQSLDYVRSLVDRYDPDWRKKINDGVTPAGPLRVTSGARAEDGF